MTSPMVFVRRPRTLAALALAWMGAFAGHALVKGTQNQLAFALASGSSQVLTSPATGVTQPQVPPSRLRGAAEGGSATGSSGVARAAAALACCCLAAIAKTATNGRSSSQVTRHAAAERGMAASNSDKSGKTATSAVSTTAPPELITDVNPLEGPEGTYKVGIDFKSWLVSAHEEIEAHNLRVEGNLPAWLAGSLVHAGPAKFEFGPGKENEFVDWVDGQAMLYRIQVHNDGSCSYRNRWLDTWNHKMHREAGRIAVRETCSRPTLDSFVDRLTYMFAPPNNENGNLHISQMVGGKRPVSMSVGSAVLEFNLSDLSTYGKVPYDDDIAKGGPLIFHTEPHQVPETNEWVTCAIQLLPNLEEGEYKPEYVLFAIDPTESQEPGTPVKRRLIRRIRDEYPAPIHTLWVTPRYIVLIQIPYPLNWDGMLKAEANWLMTGKYAGNLNDYNTWQPERPTLFRIIDRKTGEQAGLFESDAMFFFHIVNSYEETVEEEEYVVVDVVSYTEPPVGFPLEQARHGDVEDWRGGGGDVRRYRLNMTTGECTWTGWPDNCFDEPKINSKIAGKSYTYSFGVQDDNGMLRLAKLNHDTHEVKYWEGQDVSRELPWQPVFVPEPYNDKEDAGLLLSFVRDQPTGDTFMVAVNGESFEEQARVHFPKGHHVPLHGHGMWMQGTF